MFLFLYLKINNLQVSFPHFYGYLLVHLYDQNDFL